MPPAEDGIKARGLVISLRVRSYTNDLRYRYPDYAPPSDSAGRDLVASAAASLGVRRPSLLSMSPPRLGTVTVRATAVGSDSGSGSGSLYLQTQIRGRGTTAVLVGSAHPAHLQPDCSVCRRLRTAVPAVRSPLRTPRRFCRGAQAAGHTLQRPRPPAGWRVGEGFIDLLYNAHFLH